MLSPTLVARNRDTFILDDAPESTVELARHRAESALEDLDLGDRQGCEDAT
jgi:hypothetical protein